MLAFANLTNSDLQAVKQMAKSNKYDYKVTQLGEIWSTEIIRRVTSRKTVVSKKQDGFATEAEAQEWGKNELDAFLKNLKKNNQRHTDQRQQKAMKIKAKAEAGSK